MARMDAAAGTANTKVLLHPTTSPAVVQSREHVANVVADFRGRLGNEALDRARSVQGRVSSGIAERALRRRGGENEGLDERRPAE
jgi:hypothetical protein